MPFLGQGLCDLYMEHRLLPIPVEFIHLDVKVEKSSSRIINGNVGVFKNDVQTQVMLLDGEHAQD